MLNDHYGIAITSTYAPKKKEMLLTRDGGITWEKMNMPHEFDSTYFMTYQIQDSNTTVFLAEVKAYDKRLIWMHGNWDSWEQYPVIDRCHEICFINEKEGWLCAGKKMDDLNDNQLIIHTTDGGKTWETQWDYKFHGYGISDIKFFNKDIGMATGGHASVLSTYNGGKTWKLDTLKSLPPNGGDPFLVGNLQMPSITTAYVLAAGTWIYKYTRDWALGFGDEETESGELSLDQNRPNPATIRTEISYTLSNYSHVRLNIYDMLGNIRQALIDEYEGAGEHSIIFTTEGLPQGTYFYRLETEKGSVAKQMVLIR
jgi:hypothetical protein